MVLYHCTPEGEGERERERMNKMVHSTIVRFAVNLRAVSVVTLKFLRSLWKIFVFRVKEMKFAFSPGF